MSKKLKVSELQEFDAAEYLSTKEDVAAYLTTALRDDQSRLRCVGRAFGGAANPSGALTRALSFHALSAQFSRASPG